MLIITINEIKKTNPIKFIIHQYLFTNFLHIIPSINKKIKCHQSRTGIGNIFITANDKEINPINLIISFNDQV